MKEFIIYTNGYHNHDTGMGASSIVVFDKDEQELLYAASVAMPHGPGFFSNYHHWRACFGALKSVSAMSKVTIKTPSQNCYMVLSGAWASEGKADQEEIDKCFYQKDAKLLEVTAVKVPGCESAKRKDEPLEGSKRAFELSLQAVNLYVQTGKGVIVIGDINRL